MIGNIRTVALVSKNGSIDWFCFPYFDSPSIFCAILDDEKGGRFIASTGPRRRHLQATLLARDQRAHHPLPLGRRCRPRSPIHAHRHLRGGGSGYQLVRRVKVVRGIRMSFGGCHPAFNYARDEHELNIVEGGAKFRSEASTWRWRQTFPCSRTSTGRGRSSPCRRARAPASTAPAKVAPGQARLRSFSRREASQEFFRETVEYWRAWIAKCTYNGRWREMVHRSALALKLLTYRAHRGHRGRRHVQPAREHRRRCATGTTATPGFATPPSPFTPCCASASPKRPTASWAGSTRAATSWRRTGRCRSSTASTAGTTLTELTLDHLEGYAGSRPVRIGNGAYSQLQLDIYGELMDSVYLYNKHGTPISYDLWLHLRRLTDWVCDNWHARTRASGRSAAAGGTSSTRS